MSNTDQGSPENQASPCAAPNGDAQSAPSRRSPLMRRIARLPAQFARRSPFQGSIHPGRVPLLMPGSRRPTQPFPHPWNFRRPLRVLEAFFHAADGATQPGAKHNRYLDVPGFCPVLVTRDPALIRAITPDNPARAGVSTKPKDGVLVELRARAR